MASRLQQQQHKEKLLELLPADSASVGNQTLWGLFKGVIADATEADFQEAREALVGSGQAVKGKGRGGSTSRATGEARPEFDLKAEAVTLDMLTPEPAALSHKLKGALPAATPGASQVISYRHPDRRKNNPEVGLVNEASDPEQPKTTYAYDPHLDPVLQFDSARSSAEKLIEDALSGDDPVVMRAALEQLRRLSNPYLQWAGKAERTSFEVDTVSLHVHERIDAMSILSAVSKRQGKKSDKDAGGVQPGLFEAPFESLPLRSAVDFYKHDRGWANRLVAGDSLLVMNSLLQKESMAGQVQMIYIDPPYGIKYGSNFQPFTNRRDVKDRADSDLTQEPEMIKAFRDTWELGIHSYLTYLRDRLLLASELLSESGSVFVQISDENLHLVRAMLDEMFLPENFVSCISFNKNSGFGANLLPTANDYIVWYARDKSKLKYRQLYREKSPEQGGTGFTSVLLADGSSRPARPSERDDLDTLPSGAQLVGYGDITKPGPGSRFRVEVHGLAFEPEPRWWGTTPEGMRRLVCAERAVTSGKGLAYMRKLNDFPVFPLSNVWTDTVGQNQFGGTKMFVVQTALTVIERCMLMTTDPGDLVFDPTCGSGTTAFVAEEWGRRWITCDTSRVAITLAKTRLMTASFDYYELRYPQEGLKGGFIYKTVPHVTLKSIANNPELDSIHERLHPLILGALATLNKVLSRHAASIDYVASEGLRKGKQLDFQKGDVLHEWEVPFAFPPEWPPAARSAFDEFHASRQRMQSEMDRSIAAHADSETLYDRPEKSKNKLRITGPFSVEAVPFPTVLNLEEGVSQTTSDFTADAAVARSGATNRHAQWRDELMKTGIRGKGGQMLRFTSLDTLAGTTCLHCSGNTDTGEPVVLSFGPEHGALEQRQVEHAIGEAGELFPRPKMIVFCAFTFDPEAAKDIDAFKGITALKAQMNTDLLTEDLKKARSSNQSFWLMGQPDVLLRQAKDGTWQIEVNGFDYFDTVKGELVSGGKSRIAMWTLDIDYDGRSLFPHQVFFPMAGSGEGWGKLKKDIRAELDEEKLKAFQGTVSLPFATGAHRRAAVKIVDDRGIESLKVLNLVG